MYISSLKVVFSARIRLPYMSFDLSTQHSGNSGWPGGIEFFGY